MVRVYCFGYIYRMRRRECPSSVRRLAVSHRCIFCTPACSYGARLDVVAHQQMCGAAQPKVVAFSGSHSIYRGAGCLADGLWIVWVGARAEVGRRFHSGLEAVLEHRNLQVYIGEDIMVTRRDNRNIIRKATLRRAD